jgi:hypothetical protein
MEESVINPVYRPEEALTPRERRLERAGAALRWGAVINAIGAVFAALIGLAGATSTNDTLLLTLADALATRFSAASPLREDAAILAGIVLILANVSLLLTAMVGVLAQEAWSVLILALMVMANALGLILLGFFPAALTLIAAGLALYTLGSDLRAFRSNPVMLKEVRERMRGARAFVVITIYLGLMSGFTILFFLIQRGVVQEQGSAATGALGRQLFAGVVGIELLLIIFIAPAFTAGAVTTERERKTYDLLQITLLPKSSFIIGKLESALSYILLLLLAAIPLQSIAFLFGGVSETEVVLAFFLLAVTAVMLGTVGLYFSTLVDRTLTASVRTYTVAFAFMVGIPLVLGFFIDKYRDAISGIGTNLAGASPVVEAMVLYFGAFLTSLNPVMTALSTQQLLIDRQSLGLWSATLSDATTVPQISPWLTFTVIYITVSAVLIVLSIRRMRRVEL